MAQRDETIRVRVTKDEKRVIDGAAKLMNVTESEFIRQFVNFGSDLVLSEKFGEAIQSIEGLNRRIENMTGVTRGQIVRVLFLLGSVAEEHGLMTEYEELLKAFWGKTDAATSLSKDIVGILDAMVAYGEEVGREWDKKEQGKN